MRMDAEDITAIRNLLDDVKTDFSEKLDKVAENLYKIVNGHTTEIALTKNEVSQLGNDIDTHKSEPCKTIKDHCLVEHKGLTAWEIIGAAGSIIFIIGAIITITLQFIVR